jgi:hypothetical protein
MMIPVETVVKVTGKVAARSTWPEVYAALSKQGISGHLTQCAMIATVDVECPPWKPISEWGEHPEYDTGSKAKRLGNTPEADGDGQKFEGRGLIQLSGRDNYEGFGIELGLDLLSNPDLALRPQVAADIAALYFKWKKVNVAAEAKDWQKVRRLVNGGLNGWEHFHAVLQKLGVAV